MKFWNYEEQDHHVLATQSSIILGTSLTYKNCFLRLLSFLYDVILMLWPCLFFILALVSMVSPLKIGKEFIYNPIYLQTLIIISIFLCNTLSTMYYCGQTIGHRIYNLQVVEYNGQEIGLFKAFLRELFGKSIPLVFLFMYYRTFGILIYIVVNGVVVFLDPKHRSMIDFIFHTKIVLLYCENSDVCDIQLQNTAYVEGNVYDRLEILDFEEYKGVIDIISINDNRFHKGISCIKDKLFKSKKRISQCIYNIGKRKKDIHFSQNITQECLPKAYTHAIRKKSTHKKQGIRRNYRKNKICKHYKRRKSKKSSLYRKHL